MQTPITIKANGKILLTGEYLVMLGAEALAVPLVLGQELVVEVDKIQNSLTWKASDSNGVWFKGVFSLPDITLLESSDKPVGKRLRDLLLAARSLNNIFLTEQGGLKISTRLGFDKNWGFGSSSTLISLIARLAGVDSLQLHRLVSKGSGYDVVCSVATGPIVYKLQQGESISAPVDFNPPFTEGMSLVYLGSKQHSDIEVEKFKSRSESGFQDEIRRITDISRQIVLEQSQEIFIELLKEHEAIIGKVLDKKPVKNSLFPDFKGIVKSLGAWGGDFVLGVTTSGDDYLDDYFRRKSFDTILPYRNVVLKKDKF